MRVTRIVQPLPERENMGRARLRSLGGRAGWSDAIFDVVFRSEGLEIGGSFLASCFIFVDYSVSSVDRVEEKEIGQIS